MSDRGPGSRQHASDDEYLTILVFGFIFLIAFLWWLSHQEPLVNTVVGALAYVYLYPFYIMATQFPALETLPWIGAWFFADPRLVVEFLQQGGYRIMEADERMDVLRATGYAGSLYFVPVFAYIAYAAQQLRPEQSYKTPETVDTLIARQSKYWRTTRYARHVNPLKRQTFRIQKAAGEVAKQKIRIADTPQISKILCGAPRSIKPPMWSRAMRPEEWMVSTGMNFDVTRWRKLEARDLKKDVDYEFRERWEGLDIEDISETFLDQFIEPWRGYDSLEPSLRLLCAVAVLYYGFERVEGERLLHAAGLLAERNIEIPGGMNRAITNDPEISGRINAVLARDDARILAGMASEHAWKATAMIRIMEEGRHNRGILASPTYVWLRTQNRRMWYILNSIGTDAVTVEAAGVMAHYKAERQIGAPIHRPAVYQASRALLEDYLDLKPERLILRRKKLRGTIKPADFLRRHMTEHGIWEEA